ncbi:MAG: recombination regulator RecX [Treponema sp.]|jgi:regulatory protein|nr:recombination regulator RecX [Treponema sp.]
MGKRCTEMTIVSIKTGTGTELRRIELSDGSFFSFKTGYLPPVFTDESLYTPGTAEGREISAGEEAGFRFASACLRAERAALRLIARAEQTVSGLGRKLEQRGNKPLCVRAVVSRLAGTGLVDDRRFARLWLETRLGRRRDSPRRLLSALRSRGISREDAGTALQSVLNDETERALLGRFMEKQRHLRGFCAAEIRSETDVLRSVRFKLRSEGFSSGVIQRFFDEQEDGA